MANSEELEYRPPVGNAPKGDPIGPGHGLGGLGHGLGGLGMGPGFGAGGIGHGHGPHGHGFGGWGGLLPWIAAPYVWNNYYPYSPYPYPYPYPPFYPPYYSGGYPAAAPRFDYTPAAALPEEGTPE